MKAEPGWRVIAGIAACAMFMTQLDGAVLATALPQIADDFGVPTMALSLSITVYLTALVAMLPAGGWLADRFMPRRIFLAATSVFLAGSLLCALCTGYWPFIAARTLQGLGASLMGPVAMLMLLKMTPKDRLVSAMAFATAPMLLAPTFGPTLGGFLVTYASWPVIFLINLPLGAATLAFAYHSLPRNHARGGRSLDVLGLLLTSGALIALLTGIDRVAAPGGGAAGAMILVAGAALSYVAIRHLRRHPDPVIALAPLRDPVFRTTSLIAGPLIRVSLRAPPFLLPLLFQLEMGMSPLAAGAMLLALNGGDLAMKPAVALVIRRFGYGHALAAVGAIGAIAGFACILFRPGFPILGIVLILAVSGMARSVMLTGIASLSYTDVPPEQLTAANVLMNIGQHVTAAFSVSFSALLLQATAALQGEVEPKLLAFRIALATVAALGLAGTLLLYRSARTGHAAYRRPDFELTPEDR